jgi:dihydroneopterin aldolase
MKRGNTIGVRLLAEDQKAFEKIVNEEGINQSLKIAKIVHDWIHFMRSKQERGDITLAGHIISNVINAVPKKELIKIAKKNAKYVIGEMKWQDDSLDFDEIVKRIMEWNMENDRKLIERSKPGLALFKQRHDLGIGWSTHQCEMYAEMFRLIGEMVSPNSTKYNKEEFSFEIVRHTGTKSDFPVA